MSIIFDSENRTLLKARLGYDVEMNMEDVLESNFSIVLYNLSQTRGHS